MANYRRITVAGADALAELDQLRGGFSTSGLWPVLLGEPAGDDRISDRLYGSNYDPDLAAPILAAAAAIDLADWFEGRATQREEEEAEFAIETRDEDDASPEVVTWPISPPQGMGIITHLRLSGRKPLPGVVIGLFPVAAP